MSYYKEHNVYIIIKQQTLAHRSHRRNTRRALLFTRNTATQTAADVTQEPCAPLRCIGHNVKCENAYIYIL